MIKELVNVDRSFEPGGVCTLSWKRRTTELQCTLLWGAATDQRREATNEQLVNPAQLEILQTASGQQGLQRFWMNDNAVQSLECAVRSNAGMCGCSSIKCANLAANCDKLTSLQCGLSFYTPGDGLALKTSMYYLSIHWTI